MSLFTRFIALLLVGGLAMMAGAGAAVNVGVLTKDTLRYPARHASTKGWCCSQLPLWRRRVQPRRRAPTAASRWKKSLPASTTRSSRGQIMTVP